MLMAPGTKNGFPLAIEVEKMETVESEFRSEFIARMVQKVCAMWHGARAPSPIATGTEPVAQVEYGALLQTLAGLGMDGTLPPALPDEYESNEEFLRALHHVLMEARRVAIPSPPHPSHRPSHGGRPPHVQVEVIDGTLVCPETGKRFPIKDGIPSML